MPPPRTPTLSPVERRRSPRYDVDVPCEVITLQHDIAHGRIRDLSVSGLQIQGDGHFIRTLYPKSKRENWRTPLKILVKASFPTSQPVQYEAELWCQLVYCKRSSADLYKVGCQYLEISPDVQTALLDHISRFGVLKNY